nr:hypothetical protein [Tanacetum cinerariifolium]
MATFVISISSDSSEDSTRSPVIPRRQVMILSSGQPIPHGRPYRYHLNGPIHTMTARKRVRPLPVHQLSGHLARDVGLERVVHPTMPEDIPEPAQEGAAEVTYETLGDLVQRFHDHTQAIPVHRIQTTKGIQREQRRRIVGVELAVIALTERVA